MKSKHTPRWLLGLALVTGLRAESGYDAWLRYAPLDPSVAERDVEALGSSVTLLGDSQILRSARDEFARGARGMLGRVLRYESGVPAEGGVILGRQSLVSQALPSAQLTGA